jgi:hypothetical protein
MEPYRARFHPMTRTSAGVPGSSVSPDLQALEDALIERTKAMQDGDMRGVEATLFAQAHTLDAVFHKLLRLGEGNLLGHFDAAERVMRLALRA